MSLEGQSLVDVAAVVLKESKEPLNIYDLFDKACEMKGVEEDLKPGMISQFYADMTISAKFVYTGENMWDIKENQKIELWEKDGSFYKEYTEVVVPEEYLKEEKVEPKVKVEPVIEEVEEEVVVEVKEEVVEPVIEPVAKEKKEKKATKEDATNEEYEEYVGEDFDDELFDDFDEDKYNEYMDTYEDQYDD
jgi:DNA-directed RNA polymerase subunit delta